MEINAMNATSSAMEVKMGGPSQSASITKAVNEGTEAVGKVSMQENTAYQAKGSEDMLKEAIAEANAKLMFGNNDCEFMFHREINRISIKVVNRNTQEVIREIPSEETLEMLKKLKEMTGLLIDERR